MLKSDLPCERGSSLNTRDLMVTGTVSEGMRMRPRSMKLKPHRVMPSITNTSLVTRGSSLIRWPSVSAMSPSATT